METAAEWRAHPLRAAYREQMERIGIERTLVILRRFGIENCGQCPVERRQEMLYAFCTEGR